MKQKLSFLLALVIAVGVCCSVSVSATDNSGASTEIAETFVFELNEDGTGYILVGFNGSGTSIEIPGFYNDLPVVEIDTDAIGSIVCDNIVIPETIKRMTGNGFEMNLKARTVSIDNLFAWCNIDFETQYSNPLYTKKISYTSLMQEVKNKFNNLTPEQRKSINFFIPRPT